MIPHSKKAFALGLFLIAIGLTIQHIAHGVGNGNALDALARWMGVFIGAYGILLTLGQILWKKKS